MKKGGAFQRLLFSAVTRLVSFAFPIPLHHLHKQGSGRVEHVVFLPNQHARMERSGTSGTNRSWGL